MMRYTEQLLSSPIKTSGAYKSTSPTPPVDSHRITSAQDNRISLTPLWEYVVRTKSLPEGLDLDVFFQAIQERLRNPEREVRQHALRVLTDFIPVIDNLTLDGKMQIIMPDLVANLGHIGPAVRKGAIDCLRVYLNYSNNSDNILKDLVYSGLEKAQENKMRTNIVVGIIIALPFFLQRASEDTFLYAIRMLFERMVQITYQEVTLRSLVRIKDKIGEERFNEFIKFSGNNSSRKNFDLLCEVYNVNGRNINEGGAENSPYHSKSYWNDFNQNSVEEGIGWKSDTDVIIRPNQGEIIQDKVILETEIKLHSGPAITMQIHEESRQSIAEVTDSEDDGRSSMGIVKVLTDDSEEDYEPRRTPRRVRFGGEIVKLRTPDSDSNQPSDLDNDSTITITPRNGNDDKPVIEIHYTDTKTQRSTSISRSHIPVLNSKKHKSEPSSPVRSAKSSRKRMLFRSSPNLSKTHTFGDKVPNGSSKIPRRNAAQRSAENNKNRTTELVQKNKESSHTTTIQIKFTDLRSKPKIKKSESKVVDAKTGKGVAQKSEATNARTKPSQVSKTLDGPKSPSTPNEEKEKGKKDDSVTKETEKAVLKDVALEQKEQPKVEVNNKPPPLKIPKAKPETPAKGKNDGDVSPLPIHNQIEMLHNLARSPERLRPDTSDVNIIPQKTEFEFEQARKATETNNDTKEKSNSESPKHVEPKKTSEVATQVTENGVNANNKSDILPRTSEERHLTTADNVLLNREIKKPVRSRKIRTADQINKSDVIHSGPTQTTNTYSSFHVCSTTISENLPDGSDSPIPTNDNGDCLTCSSSGSENVVFDSSWEDVGVVDRATINKLNCKDDWRIRLKGLEDLNRILQNETSIVSLEPRAASLFHFLFSCHQHIRLQSTAEDILKILFSNMRLETIRGRLNQIVLSLCKMGSPAGVRLSILLMRRITVEEFLNQLLANTILGAKSSKIREGALQILMTISRIFPSTEINIPKATECVTPLLHDRKKRVRRASLETIAALAQLGTPVTVLDIIARVSTDYEDREQLIRVVRTRLSRKQLPSVDMNGSVRYSTPSGESELEWIAIGSATASPQSAETHVATENIKETNFSSAKPESIDTETVDGSSIVETNALVPFSNEQKTNYWRSNARHFETNGDQVKSQDENESDWSRDSADTKV